MESPRAVERIPSEAQRELGVQMIMQLGDLRGVRTWIHGALLVLSIVVGRCHALTLRAVFDPWKGSTSHVLDDDGMLWSWGRDAEGQLGDGTTNASLNALKMALPPGVTRWSRFEGGAGYALLDDQGRLHAWGRTEYAGTELGPSQMTPLRMGDTKWKRVVVPRSQSGLNDVPWGLGITETGELRWIRIRKPLVAGDAPFSNQAIEVVKGVEGVGPFREVVAGRHMYLALANSGKLYACGVGSWGVLGPNGNPASAVFETTFVEVPAPMLGGGWDQIAEADTQSFGWTQSGELYVWGRRFEGESNWNWGWVTDPIPRLVPRPPDGTAWVRVGGFGESQPSTLLQSASRQLWEAGDGLDVIHGRKRLVLPGGWSPVRDFSVSGRHTLYLGSDGLVRAMGNNEDYQLGGLPGGDPFNYPPVIPGGEAPFLLGKPAPVPVLRLSVSDSVIVEPATEAGVGAGAVQVLLTREERLDLGIFVSLEVRLRHADGSLVPEPESSALVGELFSLTSRLVFVGEGQTQASLVLTPKRALKREEDFLVEVQLVSHPSFVIAGDALKTLEYHHTTPSDFPPEVEVLWPTRNKAFYVGEYADVLFRVKDVDGVATQAKFRWEGNGGEPPVTLPSMNLEPVAAGVEKTYAVRIPRNLFFGTFGPRLMLRVFDNVGESTVLDFGVVLGRISASQLYLDLRWAGRTTRLNLGSASGTVALESSEDLMTWKVERTYGFPSSGLPKTPVDLGGEASQYRYFRLRNLE